MCSASFLTRPAIWIALAVILWASLVPAAGARIQPGAPGAARVSVEYCARRRGPGSDRRARGRQRPVAATRCARRQPALPVLPQPASRYRHPARSGAAAAASLPGPQGQLSPLYYQSARPPAWSAAQPRAPPAARPATPDAAPRAHAREPRLTAPRRPPLPPRSIRPSVAGPPACLRVRSARNAGRRRVRSPGLPYPSATHRAAAAPAARARGIRS